MLKTEGLGKKQICVYETYKNTVIPHGRSIYAKAYDMVTAKMCVYPRSDHVLPHWKCVLQCCAKCLGVNLPDQEKDEQYPYTSPPICFHIYHLIACCTKHGRITLTDKKTFRKCQQDSVSVQSIKIYTSK